MPRRAEIQVRTPDADPVHDSVLVSQLVNRLMLNGKKSPNSHYLAIPWPTSIIGTHKYGNELDDWAMPVTPADVVNPTFGATIYATKIDGGGVADIDAVQIYVNYCPP